MKQVHVHLHRTQDDAWNLSRGEDSYATVGELERPQLQAPASASRAVYASMPLGGSSAAILGAWAASLGVHYLEPKMHVTTAYTLKGVQVPRSYATRDDSRGIVVPPGGRSIEKFGKSLVLCLECPELEERWRMWKERGASWDFPNYQPHITFCDLKHNEGFKLPQGAEPFNEPLVLMPEIVEHPPNFLLGAHIMGRHVHIHLGAATTDSWEEGKHPRADNGQFGEGRGTNTGSGASKSGHDLGAMKTRFNTQSAAAHALQYNQANGSPAQVAGTAAAKALGHAKSYQKMAESASSPEHVAQHLAGMERSLATAEAEIAKGRKALSSGNGALSDKDKALNTVHSIEAEAHKLRRADDAKSTPESKAALLAIRTKLREAMAAYEKLKGGAMKSVAAVGASQQATIKEQPDRGSAADRPKAKVGETHYTRGTDAQGRTIFRLMQKGQQVGSVASQKTAIAWWLDHSSKKAEEAYNSEKDDGERRAATKDEGKFDESKHKRDGGKFSATQGAGAKGKEGSDFKKSREADYDAMRDKQYAEKRAANEQKEKDLDAAAKAKADAMPPKLKESRIKLLEGRLDRMDPGAPLREKVALVRELKAMGWKPKDPNIPDPAPDDKQKDALLKKSKETRAAYQGAIQAGNMSEARRLLREVKQIDDELEDGGSR